MFVCAVWGVFFDNSFGFIMLGVVNLSWRSFKMESVLSLGCWFLIHWLVSWNCILLKYEMNSRVYFMKVASWCSFWNHLYHMIFFYSAFLKLDLVKKAIFISYNLIDTGFNQPCNVLSNVWWQGSGLELGFCIVKASDILCPD